MGTDPVVAKDDGILLATDSLYYAIQICVPLLLIWAILKLWDRYRAVFTKYSNLPPGRFGWPIIGETVPFVANGRDYFQSRIEKYGNVFTSHILGRPTVVICGAENIRPILNSEHSLVENHIPPGLSYLIGSGSMACTLDAQMHKAKQKFFHESFSNDFMNRCIPLMQDSFRHQMATWIRQGYANSVPDIKRMSLLLGCKALLGFDFDGEETSQLLELYSIYNENFFSLPLNLPGTGFRKALYARKELVKIVKQSIKKRIGTIRNDNVLDILTKHGVLLRETQNNWDTSPSNECTMNTASTEDIVDTETDSVVVDLILELLFAFESTVPSAICALLIHLVLCPRVLETIRAELVQQKWVVARGQLPPLFENLLDLTYVNDVVKEVLRVSPPVAGGFRQAKEHLNVKGYHIPKGWGILYCITDTHQNAGTFEKAERLQFKPERWARLRETNGRNGHNLDRFEYLPFGAGGRRCVGKQFALLFLRLFTVEMCTLCDWKLQNGNTMPRIKTAPIPFPVDGLPLSISEAKVFKHE